MTSMVSLSGGLGGCHRGFSPPCPEGHLSIIYPSKSTIQGREMADIWEKGRRLYDLCLNRENKFDKIRQFDEIRHLLDDLSEDERRQVVNYKDNVSESW